MQLHTSHYQHYQYITGISVHYPSCHQPYAVSTAYFQPLHAVASPSFLLWASHSSYQESAVALTCLNKHCLAAALYTSPPLDARASKETCLMMSRPSVPVKAVRAVAQPQELHMDNLRQCRTWSAQDLTCALTPIRAPTLHDNT